MNTVDLFKKIINNETIDPTEMLALFKNEAKVGRVKDLIEKYKDLVASTPNDNENSIYRKLHILMEIDVIESGIGVADHNTTALTLMFGNVENAIQYLDKFQKKNPLLEHIPYQACAFRLPEQSKINLDLWRSLAIKHMPNDQLMKIFSHAPKIQEFLLKNKKEIEEEIRSEIVRVYEKNLTQQYDELQKASEFDDKQKIEYIDKQTKAGAKKIQKEAEKEFDEAIKKKLNLPLYAKLDDAQKKQIKEEKLKPESISMLKQKIETKMQALKENLEAEFAKKAKLPPIKEYISERMLAEKSFIENQCKMAILAFSKNYTTEDDKPGISTTGGSPGISNTGGGTHEISTTDGGDKLQIPKLQLSKEIDPEILFKYAKRVAYDNADKNRQAADLFFEYGIAENDFNEYLKLTARDDPKQIPMVTIDGKDIGHPNYYLKKIDPSDPIAGVLGKMTSCCQSMGGLGQACAIHGITNYSGGFYALFKKKYDRPGSDDTVVAQSWAWRGKTNRIVLDSIESQVDFKRHNEALISDFYVALGHKLVQDHHVKEVLVGASKYAGTPDLIKKYPSTSLEEISDYSGHRDSHTQAVVSNTLLPLTSVYASKRRLENPLLATQIGVTKNNSHEGYALLMNPTVYKDDIIKLLDEGKIDPIISYQYLLTKNAFEIQRHIITILEKGKFNFNEIDKNGDTLLARSLPADINAYLLSVLIKNTDFNIKNKDGDIVLVQAIKADRSNYIDDFIEHRKDEVNSFISSDQNFKWLISASATNPTLMAKFKLRSQPSYNENLKKIIDEDPLFVLNNINYFKRGYTNTALFNDFLKQTLEAAKRKNLTIPNDLIIKNHEVLFNASFEYIEPKTLFEDLQKSSKDIQYDFIKKGTMHARKSWDAATQFVFDVLYSTMNTADEENQKELVSKILKSGNTNAFEYLIEMNQITPAHCGIAWDLMEDGYYSGPVNSIIDNLWANPKLAGFLLLQGDFYSTAEKCIDQMRYNKKAWVSNYLTHSNEYLDEEDKFELYEGFVESRFVDSREELLRLLFKSDIHAPRLIDDPEKLLNAIPRRHSDTTHDIILPLLLEMHPSLIIQNLSLIEERFKDYPEFLKEFIPKVKSIEASLSEDARPKQSAESHEIRASEASPQPLVASYEKHKEKEKSQLISMTEPNESSATATVVPATTPRNPNTHPNT